jgi:hypothetical protein
MYISIERCTINRLWTSSPARLFTHSYTPADPLAMWYGRLQRKKEKYRARLDLKIEPKWFLLIFILCPVYNPMSVCPSGHNLEPFLKIPPNRECDIYLYTVYRWYKANNFQMALLDMTDILSRPKDIFFHHPGLFPVVFSTLRKYILLRRTQHFRPHILLDWPSQSIDRWLLHNLHQKK